jgi:hypothetical protein
LPARIDFVGKSVIIVPSITGRKRVYPEGPEAVLSMGHQVNPSQPFVKNCISYIADKIAAYGAFANALTLAFLKQESC